MDAFREDKAGISEYDHALIHQTTVNQLAFVNVNDHIAAVLE